MSGGIIALIVCSVIVVIIIALCKMYAKSGGGGASSSASPGTGRVHGGPVITGSPVPAASYSVNMQPVQPMAQSGTSYPPGAGYNAAYIQDGPPISGASAPTAPPPSYTEALSAPYPSNAPNNEQATKRQISDSSLPSYETFTNNSSTNM